MHDLTKETLEGVVDTPEDAKPTGQMELLSFTVGGQDYAIDIMLVREIRNWSRPTPLPKTADYVRGVINLRGTVLPILDLAKRLELAEGLSEERSVYVVINEGSCLFGITVDSVSDILTVSRESVQEPPNFGEGTEDSCVEGLLLDDERLIRILAADRLAPRETEASRDAAAA